MTTMTNSNVLRLALSFTIALTTIAPSPAGAYRDNPGTDRPHPPMCDWGNGGGCKDKAIYKFAAESGENPDMTGREGTPDSTAGTGTRSN